MSRARASLALAALLLLCLGWLARGLQIDSDLSLFLPRAHDRQSALLVDELREGVASRTLLLGIAGAGAPRLAELSRQLQLALSELPGLQQVSNGSGGLDPALRDWLMAHRYQLQAPSAETFDSNSLRNALRERLTELAAGSNLLTPREILRDPTAASLEALARLAPPGQPPRNRGVWMNAAGSRALLIARLDGAGYAIDRQQTLLAGIHRRFDELASGSESLAISGPAAFAADAKRRIESESRLLSIAASLAVMGVLFFAYRQPRILLLAALPVGSGVIAGITAVSLFFGSVHGITLAFGITVLGVAMDYPIHLFSHAGAAPRAAIDRIWPTLRLGLLTTALGYCALLLSDFDGLAQLGVFAIAGLFAAAAVTRWVLPGWLRATNSQPRAAAPGPIPRAAQIGLLAGIAALLLMAGLERRDWLETDIAALSPIPAESKRLNRELQTELGAAEGSHLLQLAAAGAQDVLEIQEQLLPLLEAARSTGELQGYDAAARLLPSARSQLQRRAQLPDEAALRDALSAAAAGLPLRAARFEPFIADIARARRAEPLLPGTAASAALDQRLAHLLYQRDGQWIGAVPLVGLSQPQALAARLQAAQLRGVDFVDLRRTSSALLGRFMAAATTQALWLGLAIAATLLLSQRQRGLRVSLAVLLALASDLALLHLLGEALTVFHVIGLLLVLGIGLDYSLFQARSGERDQGHTAHAVRTCWLTTVAVFGLLATSSIPVLHALGLTVALGVSACFLTSVVLVRPASG